MNKVRTTFTIDKNLLDVAKIQAVKENVNLSDIVEKSLRSYIPPAIGVELSADKVTYASGPTISTMKPDYFNAGVAVPGQEFKPIKDNRGVPTMSEYNEIVNKQK